MRPAPVVMGIVLGQDHPQVPLAEDQHPVGDLRPGGEHVPLCIGVRTSTSRRDLGNVNAGVGQDCVKRCGELPGPVTDQEPEVGGTITWILRRFRICCVVRGLSGFAVTPWICT